MTPHYSEWLRLAHGAGRGEIHKAWVFHISKALKSLPSQMAKLCKKAMCTLELLKSKCQNRLNINLNLKLHLSAIQPNMNQWIIVFQEKTDVHHTNSWIEIILHRFWNCLLLIFWFYSYLEVTRTHANSLQDDCTHLNNTLITYFKSKKEGLLGTTQQYKQGTGARWTWDPRSSVSSTS